MPAVLDETDATAREASIDDCEADGGPEGAGPERKGSRWNAIKHSLMAKKLLNEDLAAECRRLTALFTDHYLPTSPYEVRQVAIMGRAGAQLDRLSKLRLIDMQRGIDRASVCWNSDIYESICKIASRLSRDPARIVTTLAQTKQGAEWLSRNLRGLLQVREVERLEGLIEDSLTALDWGAQMMAMAGMPGEPDADSRQHRKYENSARREYELAKADLLASRARGEAGTADPAPEGAAPPVVASCGMDGDPDPEEESEPEPTPRAVASAAAWEERPVDPTPWRFTEVAPEAEPVSLREVAAVQPEQARVANNASRAAAPNQGRNRDRRKQHTLQKAARRAARRKGR